MALVAVMNKIKPRYLVVDDDGVAVRKFYRKQDAMNFLLTGWRIIIEPKQPVIDWATVELAPF